MSSLSVINCKSAGNSSYLLAYPSRSTHRAETRLRKIIKEKTREMDTYTTHPTPWGSTVPSYVLEYSREN